MENVIRLVEPSEPTEGIRDRLAEIVANLPDGDGQAILIVRMPGHGVAWHGVHLEPLEAVGLCEVTKTMIIDDSWEATNEA